MRKHDKLTSDEVAELFSEIDASGLVDPVRVRDREKRIGAWRAARHAGDREALERLDEEDRRSRVGRTIDPLSDDDPSGSKVGSTISRFGIVLIVGVIVLVVGMQIGYGIMRRLNTANLSESVNVDTVRRALEGGVEWGNGFTQFPEEYTIVEADERTGVVEVDVVSTSSSNELELFSNSQLESSALATNALLNDNINRVVYNVATRVDENGDIVGDTWFSMGNETVATRDMFSFIWTKSRSGESSNIGWELRIVGMDEQVAQRIQEQVNSVSSIIETPGADQTDIDAQERELQMERDLMGSETYRGGEPDRSLADVLEGSAPEEQESFDQGVD